MNMTVSTTRLILFSAAMLSTIPTVAEDSDIIVMRRVPPRIGFREKPRGEAIKAKTSSDKEILSAMGIDGEEVGLANITASGSEGNNLADPTSQLQQAPEAGISTVSSQATQTLSSGSLGTAAGGVTHTVSGATGGLANTLTNSLMPIGK